MHPIPSGTRSIPGQLSIPASRPALHTSLAAFARTIPPVMTAGPAPEHPRETLARCEGVMTRVRMVNAMLRHLGIDCSGLDSLTGTGLIQLSAAQAMVQADNLSGTRSALSQFRTTVTHLRDTYREILVREDLPGDTAQGVLSVAQSLDVTAIRARIG